MGKSLIKDKFCSDILINKSAQKYLKVLRPGIRLW